MTTEERKAKSELYAEERSDSLPFNTPEKSDRYRTERYLGAIGLNWFECDPTLQRSMRYYMSEKEYAWAEPRLTDLGALMGGPIAERAEITDKDPPQLVKYDRWGHDVSEVIIAEIGQGDQARPRAERLHGPEVPPRCRSGRRKLPARWRWPQDTCWTRRRSACPVPWAPTPGWSQEQVSRFAPPDVQQYVLSRIESGEWVGATGQFFTERTGGSDLGGLETTATPNGDSWILNGFKWFASNCDGEAFVVLAKPLGAPDSVKGNTPFLVMKHKRDGSRNGMKIRQLKAKMGTHAVASGEVEFADAEAFMLSGPPANGDGSPSDGKGMARLMAMTNIARLGVGDDGPRLRAPRPGGGDLLRHRPQLLADTAGPAPADEAQARRDDRRRGGRAGDAVRRLRLSEQPARHPHDGALPDHPAAGQAQGRAPRHHHRQRRHRDPRRQRLHRDLARRPHPPRRPDQHPLGRPRQHPLPRRPPRHRARERRRAVPRPAGRSDGQRG